MFICLRRFTTFTRFICFIHSSVLSMCLFYHNSKLNIIFFHSLSYNIIYIKEIGLVLFYGISTIVGYLMPDPFLYIFQKIQFNVSTQFSSIWPIFSYQLNQHILRPKSLHFA